MWLEKLTVENIRGACRPLVVEFEPSLTVLTGANDAGKSNVLHALRFALGNLKCLEEDVNLHFMQARGSDGPWSQDPRIKATLGFRVTGGDAERSSGVLAEGDSLLFERSLALLKGDGPKWVPRFVRGLRGGSAIRAIDQSALQTALPTPVYLNDHLEDFPTALNLGQGKTAEMRLQEIAVTGDLSRAASATKAITTLAAQQRWLDAAGERLTGWLRELAPASGFAFQLRFASEDRSAVRLELVDPQHGSTPLPMRGRGLRRLLSYLLAVDAERRAGNSILLLADEPEESLHADSQRLLRTTLESLADGERIQVVYTTHSSTMINGTRPSSVRLLERGQVDGLPTTLVVNRPYDDSFRPVRASLGMSLGDSLVFARVTVVVEGVTEYVSLLPFVERLQEGRVEGFEDTPELFRYVHFIDGTGDGFRRTARMAASHGVDVLVLLDSDKERQAKALREEYPNIEVQLLPRPMEFEDLVDHEVYVRAFAELARENREPEEPEASPTFADFTTWEKSAGLADAVMFSKRIERWVRAKFPHLRFEKAPVMRRAAKIAKANEIRAEPLGVLVEQIRTFLRSPRRPTGTETGQGLAESEAPEGSQAG